MDLDVRKEAFSCSMLITLLYSSSDSSTRPSSRSIGEPDSDGGVSESSCLHSCISSSMDILLSIVDLFRRRAGILGIAVTASKAATAGGSAFASWLYEERADKWWRCSLLILEVCVEEADLAGVRGGMPTGLDIVVVEGTWAESGDGDDDFGSQRAMDGDLFIDCVGVSTGTGLVLCGEGLERRRVPIFSDFDLEERGEGGECCI
jgi:hypothetical protein